MRLGATDCFQVDTPAGSAAALAMLEHAAPQGVRVVGSLPGAEVQRRTRAALVYALQALDYSGGIFIGGTRTERSDDRGARIASIPAIGVTLQRRLERSDLPSPIVIATVPLDWRSDPERRLVARDVRSNHDVYLPHDLKRAKG